MTQRRRMRSQVYEPALPALFAVFHSRRSGGPWVVLPRYYIVQPYVVLPAKHYLKTSLAGVLASTLPPAGSVAGYPSRFLGRTLCGLVDLRVYSTIIFLPNCFSHSNIRLTGEAELARNVR